MTMRIMLKKSLLNSAFKSYPRNIPSFSPYRSLSSQASNEKFDLDTTTHVHFNQSGRPHPLNAKVPLKVTDELLADHLGRQQNHIWSKTELDEKMSTLYRHKPKTIVDYAMNKLVYGLYHTFNFATGYTPNNPTPKSMEWRLLILESVAGVPGFVAAGVRHFRSLRKLEKDHGWIATLLEEAENERMHLLLCLQTFRAKPLTRAVVVLAQYIMVPFLLSLYAVNPKAVHRFVGYLEETACHTYLNTIRHIETPGTHLHEAWFNLPAPKMAVGYYHLPPDAKWLDTLKCIMADEAVHRDVNHTFADMKTDDPNPFLEKHKENAAIAWRLHITGEPAWPAASNASKASNNDQKTNGENLKPQF